MKSIRRHSKKLICFVVLANKGNNTSQGERDERGAIYRKLASEKQGINLLNDSIYRVGQQGHLSVEGLRTMNAHRMQNADVAAALFKKDTTGNMYLDDFAAGATNGNILSSDEISARYVARALSDNQRLADQSGAALARHIHSIPAEQINKLVNDPNFSQIVTDFGNQQTLEKELPRRQAEEELRHVNVQRQMGPTPQSSPYGNGNYYQAPQGWQQTRAGRNSARAGHIIHTNPQNPSRFYDATTNEFFS